MNLTALRVPIITLISLLAIACSQGGSASKSPDLDVQIDSGAVGSQLPTLELRGAAAVAHFWIDNQGAVEHAQITSRLVRAGVRLTMDPATGDPQRIDDLEGGSFVLLQDHGDERIDFLLFDDAGDYQNGFAIYQVAGGYVWSEIRARAAFAGQISGQLALPQLAGSFALVASTPDDLGPPVSVDPAVVAVAEQLAEAGGAVSASRCLALCGIAIAQLPLGPRLQILSGASGVLCAASYLPGLSISSLAGSKFVAPTPLLQEYIDHLLGHLVDPARGDLGAFWATLISCVLDGEPFVDPVVTPIRQTLDPRRGPLPGAAALQLPSAFLAPRSGPPGLQVACTGQALFADGSYYPLTGIVDQNGRLDCSGIRDGAVAGDVLTLLGLVQVAALSGVCNLNGINGTIGGNAFPLGECSVAREQGGQGSFTFAHFIGPGQGSIDFFYNAFSVPDQFIVRTAAGERFNTGALVSGQLTVRIAIDNEPVVFVSVRAPRNGTRWVYSVSCL